MNYLLPLMALWVIAGVGMSCAGPPRAQEGRGGPVFEAPAREVLERMAAHYRRAAWVRARVEFRPAGEVGRALTYEFGAGRPNLLALRMPAGAIDAVSLASDGERLVSSLRLDEREARWAERKAPASLAEMEDEPEYVHTPSAGLEMYFLVPLLNGTALERWLEGVKEVKYLGRGEDRSGAYHRVQLVEVVPGAGEGRTELWIDAGEKPWLRRAAVEVGGGAVGGLFVGKKNEAETLVFTGWSDAPLEPAFFRLEPLPGTKKGETLLEMEGGAHPTEGLRAPDAEWTMLDGRRVRLAEHRGERVVVLDFWASWCLPCMRSLPVVAAAAMREEWKGAVAFYAVNMGESREKAAEVVERRGFAFPVGLDPEMAVARAFGVEAIPHTVVIGRDGVIRRVHVGADGDIGAVIEREIREAVGVR